jgi:sarcosine oxidase
MRARWDVIIIGLGAMGSAAAFHLARRGQRVLGVDRYAPPHTLGSSHGQTRIIREAYFEDPAYVPLVQRAYELWDDLERETGAKLFLKTGGLMVGPPQSELVAGAVRSAEMHRLPYEMLSSAEVLRRFPVLRPPPDMVAVHEPRAGILFPEACVSAHLALAAKHGAVLRTGEAVTGWQADERGVSVTTSRATYRAQRAIVSAGAWARELLADLDPPLSVERQVVYWFDPLREIERFSALRCPIHLWQFDEQRFFYGFPDLGEGVKVALHHGGSIGTADTISREVTEDEVEDMRQLLARYLPDGAGKFRAAAVCLYTNTPDGHFWIDRHPAHPNVLIASPCSGHGFKFSSVIGELLADLATERKPPLDLGLFRNRWH